MVVGRRRKRYVLLTSAAQMDAETRKELTRAVLERYPELGKRMLWVDGGLIIRTDIEPLTEMKGGPAFRVGQVELSASLASGSISKLKRMASGGRDRHGQVLQR